jgi:tRNA(Ile)-lysidine synthase
MAAVLAAPAVAVAVSGGPDSMALLRLLADLPDGPRLHALTVDHGLRPEAAAEAAQVAAQVASWPRVTHHILSRAAPDKDAARVMESAREDRYVLMAAWCVEHGIPVLLTAHHRDDQAETFLFRLAKGSGLDGLAGIRAVSAYDERLTLVRPLLGVAKAELVTLCETRGVPFASDPTNANTKFARSRLRAAMEILAAEGLSPKRLAVTALRFARARGALEYYAKRAFDAALVSRSGNETILNAEILRAEPEETRRRVIAMVLAAMEDERGYSPRMEALEELTARLFDDPGFTRSSLRHCVIARRRDGTISISRASL